MSSLAGDPPPWIQGDTHTRDRCRITIYISIIRNHFAADDVDELNKIVVS